MSTWMMMTDSPPVKSLESDKDFEASFLTHFKDIVNLCEENNNPMIHNYLEWK